MASSGTSMTAAVTVITHQNHSALTLTFTNGSAGELKQGQSVNIKGSSNYTVELRDSGTADFPAGIVIRGGIVGEKVSVLTPYIAVKKVHAKGGTINAGAFVKTNGVFNADGLEEVVAAASGDYVTEVVIKGGAVDTVLEVGVLNSPVRIA